MGPPVLLEDGESVVERAAERGGIDGRVATFPTLQTRAAAWRISSAISERFRYS
jgi:hypothetical protein